MSAGNGGASGATAGGAAGVHGEGGQASGGTAGGNAGAPGGSRCGGSGRLMENLGRGLVAVKVEGGVFVSFRLLATEPLDLEFNVYRGDTRLNAAPLT
ncbi:MAG: rhamnogalacturonan lyase, partial [Acidimicrobiia bacterium]